MITCSIDWLDGIWVGGTVHDDDGKTWIVARNSDGQVLGFSRTGGFAKLVHPGKNA